MSKNQEKKYQKRLENIWTADQSEWERRFLDNQEFESDLRNLRTRFNIRINSVLKIAGWFDAQTPETLFQFSEKVKELSEKYDIGAKWTDRFWKEIWQVNDRIKEQTGMESFRGWSGFPVGRVTRKGTEIIHELIIKPETDIDNPLVIEFIKAWQRNRRNDPPMPIQSQENPRKLDWRPVWEWRKRHPGVSYAELAEMLNYHPVTVRRALTLLDKEN
jgi:hypothetical protein